MYVFIEAMYLGNVYASIYSCCPSFLLLLFLFLISYLFYSSSLSFSLPVYLSLSLLFFFLLDFVIIQCTVHQHLNSFDKWLFLNYFCPLTRIPFATFNPPLLWYMYIHTYIHIGLFYIGLHIHTRIYTYFTDIHMNYHTLHTSYLSCFSLTVSAVYVLDDFPLTSLVYVIGVSQLWLVGRSSH